MSNSVVMSIWEELYGDETNRRTPCQPVDCCSCKKPQKIKTQKSGNIKGTKSKNK